MLGACRRDRHRLLASLRELRGSRRAVHSAPSRFGRALLTALFTVAASHPLLADSLPDDLGADELLQRAFDNLYADDYVQTLQLVSTMRGGREIARTLQIVRKQSVRPGKALIRFLSPHSIRRTSILVLENEKRSDDMYVYLPSIKHTKHLSNSQRADSFFGTDFSYEDVEPKRASDYRAHFLGEAEDSEPCRQISIHAHDHIETMYDHLVACIDPSKGLIHWVDYYLEADEAYKRLVVDVASVRGIEGRLIPFSMTMATPGRSSQTHFVSESYELVADIPDRLFSAWNLEAGDADRDRSSVD